jgi:uncharacterized membrane protein
MINILNIITIILASIYVLFLPGFMLSFVFFAKGKIDLIERIALSFALSIAVVPLFAFYLNLLGIPINRDTVILEVLIIIFITLAILVWQRRFPLLK